MEKYEKPVMEVEEVDDIQTISIGGTSGNCGIGCVSGCPPTNPR